mgnify:FL=1
MSEDKLLQVFIEEANEILVDLDTNLIELEDNPRDQELINQIFRSLHTLKGSASLTGLTDIADFVHHGEDLLDQVRNGELEINSEIINLLLQVHDLVEDMVKEVTTAGFEYDRNEVEEVESSLKYFLNHETAPQSETEQEAETNSTGEQIYKIKLKFNEDLFATGTDPLMLLEELAELGEVIDSNINLTKIPEIYNLNPEKCYLNITVMLKTEEPREKIDDVFVFVEFDNEIEIKNVTDHFSDDLDISLADKLTGEILVDRGIVDEEDIEEALAQQNRIGDLLEKSGKVSKKQVDKVVQEQKKSKEVKEKSTIKVDTDKLEDLMNSMAELVISQSKVRELVLNKADLGSNIEINNALDEVDKKVRGLQEEIMNARMIPIGSTFMRFKRLVRDLSQEQGKEINLEIKGKETELDKTVIEEIGDPLKHMIRNSIDHGIEIPEEREAEGKSREGTITLNAYHKEGKVIIEIKDDGRGLDKDKILAKARENGIIGEDEELPEREIYQLIMEPGFSTSEEITETSGRGVGMDVVKSNIEKLRGSVNISSQPGAGTTFKLKLPLTLAIIDGMKVKIGDEYFIIPLNSIVEFIQPFDRQLKTVEGKGEVVKIRDKYVILSRLSKLLDVEADVQDPTEGIVIIVQDEGREICLLVDEILGQQQAVIKSLEDNYTYVEGLSGAAILGDGNVAMILDIATIINMSAR